MLRGIFALFFRSLRGDSRSIWVHISWFFLLLAIYIAMCSAVAQSLIFGAPGLTFFKYVIYCNAVILTLLGISYFSSVISEEKEEDTLGLMTMAGINPLGILLGKSTTRLFQVFLLLAVQFPFTLLAITMGGLTRGQIYSAYTALLSYTILLANAGLLSSVLCRRNRTAAGLTTLWTVFYMAIPVFAVIRYEYLVSISYVEGPYLLGFIPSWLTILRWTYQCNIFAQFEMAMETNYEFAWTPQFISNSIGGIFLFLLSWLLFGFMSHESTSEASTRAMVPRRTGRLRWLSTGRAWNAALAWKDFHFIAGGWFGVLVRCGLYIGLYWLAYAANYPWRNDGWVVELRPQDVTWGYQFFVVPLFVVDCAMCVSRLFQEEIRLQTISSLLMLPRSVPYIAYSKLAGCLVGLIPGMVALFTAFFLLFDTHNALLDALDEPASWWLIANLFLLVHLSAMLSLYLRWGAFAMSLALTAGLMFVSAIVVETLMFATGGVRTMQPDHAFGMLAIPTTIACVACHIIILLRLPALGEK